jgi:hypothetical protein
MASNVGIGGAIGAGIGALFIPFLGPGAIPIMVSLATAGAGIGSQASTAGRVEDLTRGAVNVVDRRSEEVVGGVLEIANRRSKEALEGLGKGAQLILIKVGEGSHHLLIEGGKAVGTWNRFLLAGTVTAGSLGIGHLADLRRSSQLCLDDPDDFGCKASLVLSILTTTTACVSCFLVVGKACLYLLREEPPQVLPQTPTPQAAPSAAVPLPEPPQPPINPRKPDTARVLLSLRERNARLRQSNAQFQARNNQ